MTGTTRDELIRIIAARAPETRRMVPEDCADIADGILSALPALGYRKVDDNAKHIIEIRHDGWTIQHPLRCRPNLFECPYNQAAGWMADAPVDPGRYECELDQYGLLEVGREVKGDAP